MDAVFLESLLTSLTSLIETHIQETLTVESLAVVAKTLTPEQREDYIEDLTKDMTSFALSLTQSQHLKTILSTFLHKVGDIKEPPKKGLKTLFSMTKGRAKPKRREHERTESDVSVPDSTVPEVHDDIAMERSSTADRISADRVIEGPIEPPVETTVEEVEKVAERPAVEEKKGFVPTNAMAAMALAMKTGLSSNQLENETTLDLDTQMLDSNEDIRQRPDIGERSPSHRLSRISILIDDEPVESVRIPLRGTSRPPAILPRPKSRPTSSYSLESGPSSLAIDIESNEDVTAARSKEEEARYQLSIKAQKQSPNKRPNGFMNPETTNTVLSFKKKENSTSGDDKALEKRALAWLNSNLKAKEIEVTDLTVCLSDGLNLIYALENATEKSVGKFNKKAMMQVHKLDNISVALAFLTKNGVNTRSLTARGKNCFNIRYFRWKQGEDSLVIQ